MVSTNETDGNREFVDQLRQRTQEKAKEYVELVHKQRHIEMLIERTKTYVEELNKFLEHEGQPPIPLKEPRPGSVVGKPGNRAKDLPIRKAQWEGMTIDEIIQQILNASPNEVYHPNKLASQVYEIHSDSDLRMVIPNFRSMVQRGARVGLWDRVGRAKFKAKVTVEQGKPVNA